MNSGWSKTLKHSPNTLLSLLRLALPRKTNFQPSTGLAQNCLQLNQVRIHPKQLDQYCTVCELEKQHHIPALYPQVLVSPLQLALLSDRRFPLSMLGAVHKRNHITQTRPIDLNEILDLSVNVGEFRCLEKGIEIDLRNQVRIKDELVWESISSYFVPRSHRETPYQHSQSHQTDQQSDQESPENTGKMSVLPKNPKNLSISWLLATNKGLKYAAISGDYNPIHIATFSAKLFGFKRNIAHGFCLLATSLEQHPATQTKLLNQTMANDKKTLFLDVEFRGPNFLGETIAMNTEGDSNRTRMDLYCGNNPKPTVCVHMSLTSGE